MYGGDAFEKLAVDQEVVLDGLARLAHVGRDAGAGEGEGAGEGGGGADAQAAVRFTGCVLAASTLANPKVLLHRRGTRPRLAPVPRVAHRERRRRV